MPLKILNNYNYRRVKVLMDLIFYDYVGGSVEKKFMEVEGNFN